jgi:hypothetical protein
MATLQAVARGVIRVLRAPMRLSPLSARRLTLRLPARMLTSSDPRIRTEPAAADRAWSLPECGHRDSSSPLPRTTPVSRSRSDRLGHFWRADVGHFSRAPKPLVDCCRVTACRAENAPDPRQYCIVPDRALTSPAACRGDFWRNIKKDSLLSFHPARVCPPRASTPRAKRRIFSPESRRAFVATEPHIFGLGRMMEIYREGLVYAAMQVFYSMDEALKWLGREDEKI